MSVTPETIDAVEAFLEHAAHGEGREGVRLALGLLDDGVPSDDVIVHVLAAAQREVGERWLHSEWTIADEHLATGVAQKALDAVADSVEAPPPTGLVILACAEGDWHALPAQMFAELLRSHGFAVSNLGASTPVDHVEALLERDRPFALAVTCSLPLAFRGVASLVQAAHRHGIPVLAGGRALGAGSRRAERLGADGWAAGIDDAVTGLRHWQRVRPVLSSGVAEPDPGIADLEQGADALAAEALEELRLAYPSMAGYDDRQVARTLEDLAFIVRFTAAARLVDDPEVLTEFLDWLRTLLAARGVPSAALDAGVQALAPRVARIDPPGGQLLVGAIEV